MGDGPEEAEPLLEQSVAECDTFESPWAGLVSSTYLAEIAPQTGKIREARERLAERYARLTEGFDRDPARKAKAALDKLAGLLDATP